ncbi:unnamed protein product [Oreochromis niloticus]|nr:unnamed protein product [Mustela putorius furo]
MLTLIWVILLFADKGLTRSTPPVCTKSKDNVTLSQINITAEAGLYAVLPCSFTTDDGFDAKSITLYKHGKTIFDSSDDQKNNSEFQRRVSLLESDLKMKNCSVIINDLTETDSGSYQVRVSDNKTEHGCTLKFTVTVTDLQELKISGSTVVKKGATLNLTCSADSFIASSINWIKSDSNKNLNRKNENKTTKGNGSASLTIFNMTPELSGQYKCIATHKNKNITKTIDVKLFAAGPRILNSSGCEVQSEVLSCMCISEEFPPPTIKWPHLKSHTEYSVTTNVSNARVTSTITVFLKHYHYTTIECVTSKDNEHIKNEDVFKQRNEEPKVKTAALRGFLIGVIVLAIIGFLVTRCYRKNQSSENLSEDLDVVTTDAVPLMDADKSATNNRIHEPGKVKREAESTA